MKKKYDVYLVFTYTDDNLSIMFYKKKDSEYKNKEEAMNRVHEIIDKGYNAEIVETWGK